MKKFLRLWLRHPISVTCMIVMMIIALQTHSIYPIIIGLIPSALLFVIWEAGLASFFLEKEFWKHLIENEKSKNS